MTQGSYTSNKPEIAAGDWVRVRTADGEFRTKRALTAPVGVDVDFPVVWVCDPSEFTQERAFAYPPVRGRWEALGRPWPLEDVEHLV